MAVLGYRTLVILLLLVTGLVAAPGKSGKDKNAKNIKPTDGRADATTTATLPKSTSPPLLKCRDAFCDDSCTFVKELGAVCTCTDDRTYLGSDKHTCHIKTCGSDDKTSYKCGAGSYCTLSWDFSYRKMMATCKCSSTSRARYTLASDKKSCIRDSRYKTCDYPKDAGCDQVCKVKNVRRGRGTNPVCSCSAGHSLTNDKKTCKVTDPCRIGGKNGGCQQTCSFDRNLKVTCSCHSKEYSLNSNGKTCTLKSCSNGNTGCQQGCTQYDSRNYGCHCDLGFTLNADKKTCFDVDECSGFHGCDHKCVPDGSYYKCACYPGYYLLTNGYSCRVNEKCIQHDCSQHCNPTTGFCSCDPTHQLDTDGKTCIDIDECATGKNDCQEKCENIDGGYACSCYDSKARLSNDLKTCVLDTCEELTKIDYGSIQCYRGHGDQSMKVGDYCKYSCQNGMTLRGAPIVRCTISGYDYTPPHCEDIDECKDQFRCLEDERCANTIGGFNCFCKQGYSRENGKCVDQERPQIIKCPLDQNLQLPDDADSVKATWVKPTVFDATDANLNCINCPQTEERVLKVGDVSIRYIYSDEADNKALCSFKIKVTDITPPVFSGCPNGTVFTKGPGIYSIDEFAKVTATDNSGATIKVTNDKPPQFDKPGLRTVNYHARDDSGNHATCSFYVNITINECPELAPPKNGVSGCADWHVGTFCLPKCNDGFEFYDELPSTRYHCGDDGTWNPSAIPDCHPTSQPVEADIKYVSKYKGECPNDTPASLKQVTDMSQNTFDNAKSVFCFVGDSCSLVGGPEVTCDDDHFTVSLKTDENYSQIPEHDEMLLQFKKKIRAAVANQRSFMGLFIPPFTLIEALVDKNALPTTPIFRLECNEASKRVGNKCVCPTDSPC